MTVITKVEGLVIMKLVDIENTLMAIKCPFYVPMISFNIDSITTDEFQAKLDPADIIVDRIKDDVNTIKAFLSVLGILNVDDLFWMDNCRVMLSLQGVTTIDPYSMYKFTGEYKQENFNGLLADLIDYSGYHQVISFSMISDAIRFARVSYYVGIENGIPVVDIKADEQTILFKSYDNFDPLSRVPISSHHDLATKVLSKSKRIKLVKKDRYRYVIAVEGNLSKSQANGMFKLLTTQDCDDYLVGKPIPNINTKGAITRSLATCILVSKSVAMITDDPNYSMITQLLGDELPDSALQAILDFIPCDITEDDEDMVPDTFVDTLSKYIRKAKYITMAKAFVDMLYSKYRRGTLDMLLSPEYMSVLLPEIIKGFRVKNILTVIPIIHAKLPTDNDERFSTKIEKHHDKLVENGIYDKKVPTTQQAINQSFAASIPLPLDDDEY